MDSFVYRKNLLDPGLVRQLCQRSNRPGMLRLCIHLAIIGAGAALVWIAGFSWWLLPAWTVYGTVLVFLFAPLHECIHRTAFRSRKLNEAVATAVGFLLLLPANYFRAFHFAHHRYTNDPEKDPELLTAKPASAQQYVWAMCGLASYWWPQIRTILLHARGRVDEAFIPESDHKKIILEARLHLIAYGTVFGISIASETIIFLMYWVVPVMLGMVALRLFLLAEHAGCELSDNMLKNTRTTLTNPAVNLLTWNMPYHCEHHVFPAVPFHQLPALHQHLKPRLAVVSDGYRRFHGEFLESVKTGQA